MLEEFVDMEYEALFINWLVEDTVHADLNALIDSVLVLERGHGKNDRLDEVLVRRLLTKPFVGL